MSSHAPSRRALVRRPSPRLADGLVTHLERRPVDVDLAARQWESYVAALDVAGWEVVEVEPAPDHPDGVFVEDTVVVHHDLAVLTRPGASSRRGEVSGAARALRSLGYRVTAIEEPGHLDGGDVLQTHGTVYVGRGGRTDAAGIRQLREALTPSGARVVAVPLTKALHLKSAVTALPDGTVIGYGPVVDEPAFFPHFRAMPEEPGAHVVDLGEGRLLVSAAAPRSIELLADWGWLPVPVDISQYELLEGCVTCLSVRLRHQP